MLTALKRIDKLLLNGKILQNRLEFCTIKNNKTNTCNNIEKQHAILAYRIINVIAFGNVKG